MATLNPGDFELDGYPMGLGAEAVVEDWDLGNADVVSQDSTNPITGRRRFGRDTLTGPTWVLSVGTRTDTAAAARSVLGRLAALWSPPDGDAWAPGATSTLRYNIDGETRRVYGRPRKFAPVVGGMLASGYASAVGEFTTEDAITYADDVEGAAVSLVPASTGGFTVPFTTPIITASTGEIQGTFTNSGEVSTPFVLSIQGPVSNPRIEGDGWSIELGYTLAYDEVVTIDTREATVLNNFGASVAGAVTIGHRLYEARLKPGPGYIRYSGIDASGTSTAAIAWRPARRGL